MKQELRLIVVEGPESGRSFLLSDEKNTIGRGEDNTICIIDAVISKRHCQIIRSGGAYFIVDLNSKNGTYLNGMKLAASKLYEIEPASTLKVGSCLMALEMEDVREVSEKQMLEDEDTTQEIVAGPGGISVVGRRTGEVTGDEEGGKTPRPKTITFRLASNRNLAAVYKILSTVGTAADMEFLLNTSMDLIMEVIGPERGFLFLKESLKGDEFYPRVVKTQKHARKVSKIPVSRRILLEVMAKKESLFTSETPDDERFTGIGAMLNFQINSILCAPIKSKDELLGLIYLDTTSTTDMFKTDDLELLATVGIQLGTLMENKALIADNQELFVGVVRALINIIEAKDQYTFGHSERVTAISVSVAGELQLSSSEIETVRISGLLHDIGKVVVPEEILNKPGKLTDEEFSQIKKHPVIGRDFVRHIRKFDTILDGILYHHERYDGKGYPEGLSGEKIPQIARIISVADSFDAMTSDRAYRKGMEEQKALDELLRCQGTQFDPRMVLAFSSAYKAGRIKRDAVTTLQTPLGHAGKVRPAS